MTIQSAQLSVTFKASQKGSNDMGGSFDPLVQKIIDVVNGTGAGQADLVYTDNVTIAASGTADLDLAGAMTDAFGRPVVGVKLKGIIVIAAAGNTNNVLVGGAASNQVPFLNAVTDKIKVPPGGVLALYGPALAGLGTITAATGDQLGFANSGSGTGVTFDLVLLMASA